MKKCKNCKHWGTDNEYSPPYMGGNGDIWARCESEKANKEYFTGEEIGHAVSTSEKFVCPVWELKQEKDEP